MIVETRLETKATESSTRQSIAHSASEFLSSIGLSILFAVFLLGSLIYFAGPWQIAANTRLLDVLINAGIVKYHDRNAGFIEGIPEHVMYMKSQEPIEWLIVLLVMIIFSIFWVLKAFQFHKIALYHGIPGSFTEHARAYAASSLTYKRFTPLRLGDAATAAELQIKGATTEQSHSTVFLFKLFVVFEIAIYGLFGLIGAGWAAWLIQLVWAIVVFSLLYWWIRPSATEPRTVSVTAAAKAHIQELLQRPSRLIGLALLSLLAFGLLDISAYLLTMAFSTQEVLLHADFSVLLMAFVAGYIARQIPLSPGGIGQFEWAFTAALVLGGMGLPEAASVALIFSFFQHLTIGILYLVSLTWRNTKASLQTILNLVYNPTIRINGEKVVASQSTILDDDVLTDIPVVPMFRMPSASVLWRRALTVGWVIAGVFFFNELTILLSNYWLLDSLQVNEVFWTNFRMSATLFAIGTLLFAAGVSVPALTHRLTAAERRFVFSLAGLFGVIAGFQMASGYEDYLLWFNGLPFNETDPIFNRDIGFYLFSLPAWWVVWETAMMLFIVTLISSMVCANLSRRQEAEAENTGTRLGTWIGAVSTGTMRIALLGIGIISAIGIWISRYELLLKEDKNTSVFTGASYIDVNGLFSTLNQIQLTAIVVFAITIILAFLLGGLHQRVNGRENSRWASRLRTTGLLIFGLIALDFFFAGIVSIRETVAVTPDQPVIQLPYIEQHIAATRQAYGLDKVEEIEFKPRTGDAPLPDLEKLLASNAIKNAPLWPTYVNYLEKVVDPQHADRILQTGGDNMIYGPTLEIFRQQEKLRTYYDFMDIDILRYTIDGEKVVLASAVRELPILEPQPWLAWWGQRFMLFTHGHGMVMSPVGAVDSRGEPEYVSGQIPVQSKWPEITAKNQQVYYGEGNASMAVSNVRDMTELDYPTDQGRAENLLPSDFPGGVKMNSLLKRIVFGWQSGEFWEMVFSSIVTKDTRIHIYRQPMNRLDEIAPFLYYESNPHATLVDGNITWLVNAVTVSDQYPYSRHGFIGDKSLSRTPKAIDTKRINYVEDAVKATINATTGEVKFYKISDEPVINTWAAIYPSLFTNGEQMPKEVRQQLTYPLHLFHLLFDDLYIYYHMNDPMYFFNMEDMWDDADEVLGPIMDQGKSITFSMEPYHLLVQTGTLLPAAQEQEQFAMTMPFTPEGARNLRAMPMVYQDGPDYGRLFVLMVPKGMFVLGPEQADAVIDQDPDISEKISWWNRRGTEVIRGHTSALLIEDEVIYVEPIFIRSQQNSVPQLQRVIVVVRGQPYMAETIEKALQKAYNSPLLKTALNEGYDAETETETSVSE